MAISTGDGLVAALPAFGTPILKAAFAPQVASSWHSLWTVAGIPGAGSNSADGAAGAVPLDSTAGAFPFTNSNNTYLCRFAVYSNQIGVILLYDRLWHNSGLSATLTTSQTVNSVALTRPDANGADAEAWWQCYGTMGAGTPTITITYTDQDGNASNTGTLQQFVTTAATNRTFPFGLAAGDTGVRSIQNYQNSATMTSGTFGLIIRRYVTSLSYPVANASGYLDPIGGGLPRVYDDACLELIWFANSTASVTIGGQLALAQG